MHLSAKIWRTLVKRTRKLAAAVALIFAAAVPAAADDVGDAKSQALADAPATLIQLCRAGPSTERTLRACTTALRAAPPSKPLRADLYARRAVHALALGDTDGAARDFTYAARLGDSAALAALGAGFEAVDRKQPDRARAAFDRCSGNDDLLALAQYGLGLAHALDGDPTAARQAYARAQTLQPAWSLPTT